MDFELAYIMTSIGISYKYTAVAQRHPATV